MPEGVEMQFGPDDDYDYANIIGTLVSKTAPIREAVIGYREGLLKDGFSVPAADMMAVELHRNLLGFVFTAVRKVMDATPAPEGRH